MNLFDLFATIRMDSSEYEAGLDNAEKGASSLGRKLKSGLAGAAKTATAAVAGITAGAAALGTAAIKGASNLSQYGDHIDKMSQKLGLSRESFQMWDYVLGQSGADINSMSTGLKTLTNKLDEAKNGSSDAQKMFEALGLSFDDISSMSREDVFEAVISGFQGMADSTERAALANDLFGKSGQELTPLFNTSIEETQQLKDATQELGMILSDEAVGASADYVDALDTMQRTFAGVKNSITSDMLPGLTSIMEGLTALISGQEGAQTAISEGMSSLVGSITEGIGKASEIGQTLLPAIVSAIIENLPELAESGIELMQTLMTTVIENIPLLIDAGIQILQSLAESLIENLPTLIDSVIESVDKIAKLLTDPETLGMLLESLLTIILTIVDSLIENLPTLINTFMTIIDNIVTFVLNNLPLFIDAAVKIIIALMNGFIEALPTLLGYLPTIIDSIINGLLYMLPQIIDAGITLLTALIDNMPVILRTIGDKMPEIIEKIVNTLTDNLPKIVEMGITLLTALIDDLPEIVKTIAGEIPRIINGIINKLTDLIPEIVTMGFDLLVSLLDNLPQIIIELVKQLPQIITAIVNGLLGGVSELWGVGKALIEGLWNGILSVGDWLKDKIGGFFSGIWGGIKSFFGIASPSKKFAWVGEMLDKGLAQGIDRYADVAIDAAESMAEDVSGAVNSDMDFTVGAGAGGVGAGNGLYGHGNSVVINVQGAEGQNVNELAEVISQRMAYAYNAEKAVWA